MLKADYIPSNRQYSDIFQHLTQLVANQVTQQLTANMPRSFAAT